MEEKENLESEFEYRVTDWSTKKDLSFVAGQLEKYNIPYVWKCRNGDWAIFRSFAEEDRYI